MAYGLLANVEVEAEAEVLLVGGGRGGMGGIWKVGLVEELQEAEMMEKDNKR